MTTSRAIIRGSFCDHRPVKTRSAYQLIIEVPIEQTLEVLTTLGVPMPGQEIPVAIALLTLEDSSKPKAEKERRRFNELPYSQQAAMRCQDEAFQKFLLDEFAAHSTPNGAAHFVRHHCGVDSRSELDSNSEAGARWVALRDKFQAWMALA